MNFAQEAYMLMMDLMLNNSEIRTSHSIHQLAKEIIDVPERPESYAPAFIPSDLQVVVLLTGGLDSTAVWVMAEEHKKRVPEKWSNARGVYVDIGQPYAGKEIAALNNMGIPFYIIRNKLDQKFTDMYWKHIIPGRNLYMIAAAAERIEESGGLIGFGVTEGESPEKGGDKSKRFIRLLNEELAKTNCRLWTPLQNMTKTDVVGYLEKTRPGLTQKTVSCFSSETGHCGRCQACLRKYLAFSNNGLKLFTNVPVKVGCIEYINKYVKAMANALEKRDYTKYSERRCKQDLTALMKLVKD